MTTNHIPARWPHIAAPSVIFSATVAVAAMVATPAAAEPRQPGQRDSFNSCFFDAWNKKPTMSYAEKQKVAEDCCLNVGGIFNETAHVCYLGADNVTVAVPNPTPPPPTRATIAPLPPGATNRN